MISGGDIKENDQWGDIKENDQWGDIKENDQWGDIEENDQWGDIKENDQWGDIKENDQWGDIKENDQWGDINCLFKVFLYNSCTVQSIVLQLYDGSSTTDVSGVMTGELYAGKFSLDNQWYRVQIRDISKDQIGVLFVDFGNMEMTTLDQLRMLDHSLARYPAQVSHVTDA